MRGLILISIIAVASVSCRPEIPSGYSYQQPPQASHHHHSSGGHAPASHSNGGGGGYSYQQPAPAPVQHHSSGGHASSGHSSGGGGGYSYQQPAPAPVQVSFVAPAAQSFSAPSTSYGAPAGGSSFGVSAVGPSFGDLSSSNFGGGFQQGPALAPIVQKHIYVHVPPPEDEVAVAHQAQLASTPRKHYKIIFIKAPSSPSIAQQAAAAAAQNEEKTIVYVLVKKPEELDAAPTPSQSAPLAPSKPEVYFIKYKTQSEAGSAVGQSFGGGSAGGAQSFGGYESSGVSSGGQDAFVSAPVNPQSAYGPPSKRF